MITVFFVFSLLENCRFLFPYMIDVFFRLRLTCCRNKNACMKQLDQYYWINKVFVLKDCINYSVWSLLKLFNAYFSLSFISNCKFVTSKLRLQCRKRSCLNKDEGKSRRLLHHISLLARSNSC